MATTEEITITELELAEEILGDMVVAVDTTGDTKSVTLKQLRAWLGSSLPTGFILPAVGKISDERFALLDGRQLAKQGTFQAFCAKVEQEVQAGNWFACTDAEYEEDLTNYGQCGKFVIGQDYVRIPTITRFIGATVTLAEIGKTYKESLPNIYGNSGVWLGNVNPNGAFSQTTQVPNATIATGTSTISNVNFNAGRVSLTYQDDAKVQPDHTKYPYYMVVSTEGQTSPVEVDINQVFEDLLSKENTFNKVTNFDNPSDTTYPTTKAVDSRITDIMESGDNYIRFKSGLLIQWGNTSRSGNETTISLTVPYINNNYSIVAMPYMSSVVDLYQIMISSKTTTNFNIYDRIAGGRSLIYNWVTIGLS